jgi:hypothetical protein
MLSCWTWWGTPVSGARFDKKDPSPNGRRHPCMAGMVDMRSDPGVCAVSVLNSRACTTVMVESAAVCCRIRLRILSRKKFFAYTLYCTVQYKV